MNYTIQNAFLTVSVEERGAQMLSVLGADGTQFLWQGNPRYWADRAINIFPYIARLTQGSYYLDGKMHRMPIHGFAPSSTFAMVEHTDEKLVMELCSDDKTKESYPRDFRLQIIYRLEENRLVIEFRVDNLDEKPMYFGIGGHPGINVPLEAGKSFSDYRLRFSQPCQPQRVGFTEDCFVNGQMESFLLEEDVILPLDHKLFDNDAIVLSNMAKAVTLETPGGKHSVSVEYPQMDYLGLWHCPKTEAPYVCIEPWSSLPSKKDEIAHFEKQKDLICLEPGGCYQNRWQMTFV